jgi:transcriptional regulator with XRE-family HTH domain
MTGTQMRTLRNQMGWTQYFLADCLGVTRPSLAHWEGDRAPVPPTIARSLTRVHKTVYNAIRGMHRIGAK